MKCAVSDFDRTLYVNETVSEENIRAVRAWQQAGHWFVIATGRNETSVREKLERYGICPDALILNNGAVIRDAEGKELFCRLLKDEAARRVLRYLHGLNDDGSGVSTREKKWNVLSASHTTTQKAGDGTITIDEIEGLSEIVQIHRRRPGDEEGILQLCEEVNRRFPEVSAYANVWNADIVAHGVNKAAAIGWLERYMGGFEEIRVIGDSRNDVEMIRRYRGAAPRHAGAAAREAAAVIVEDVAEYLRG